MANKYSKLSIDLTKLDSWIRIWCEENLDASFTITKRDIKEQIQYTIVDEKGQIKLVFFKCNGGLLTIQWKVGTRQSESEQLVESIYRRVSDVLAKSPYANGFSISLSEDEFHAVIGLLQDEDEVKTVHEEYVKKERQATYYIYQLMGIKKDRVTIKYFPNTKRMQVQGKPLKLFNDIVALVAENHDNMDDVVESQIEYCRLPITKDEIYEEMDSVLGHRLYVFLGDKNRAIISSSFIHFKIITCVEMTDYSCLVFPAWRALEGFAKRLFTEKGLKCIGQEDPADNKLGRFFGKDSDSKLHYMYSEFSQYLDEDTEKVLTELYRYYYRERHQYAHSSGDDFQTAIISDKNVAYEKFTEVIKLMQSCCEIL